MPPELTNAATFAAPLSILALLQSLGLGAALAWLICWHFRRFGSTLANRVEFARVLPFVLLTTILIIAVVKSSLALSLGLVGALSIVRFRTPIKEPEELAYLFVSLAIGVGLGAQQHLATVVAALTILTLMAAYHWSRRERDDRSLYLTVDLATANGADPLTGLQSVIGRHATTCDLRRFDQRDEQFEATWVVDLADMAALADLSAELRSAHPGIGITFLDQTRLPSM